MPHESLMTPFKLKNLEIKNRVVMAPMTRSKSPNHIPSKDVATYYRRRAEGDVGLIITEGTIIDHPAGHGYPDVPNIYGKEAMEGWRSVVQEVHAAGGLIFPQLWHVGSVRQSSDHENAGVDNPQHQCHSNNVKIPGYGPSAVPHPYVEKGEIPHEMTQKDIDEVIAAFAKAAKEAKEIGFDGVEIHGAHGYLIDQFFWEATNKRYDQYGGQTLAERTRFATEVIAAVREAAGLDYPISFRFSQWKLGDYTAKMAKTPQELEAFLTPLAAAGVDIFHCSNRRFFEPEFPDSTLNLAGWTKKITGKPSITVGSIGLDNDFIGTLLGDEQAHTSSKQLDELNQRLANGEFDLVAVGRMLLSNPAWVQKIKEGKYDDIRSFSKEHLGELH